VPGSPLQQNKAAKRMAGADSTLPYGRKTSTLCNFPSMLT
jgi:hypothetical protein